MTGADKELAISSRFSEPLIPDERFIEFQDWADKPLLISVEEYDRLATSLEESPLVDGKVYFPTNDAFTAFAWMTALLKPTFDVVVDFCPLESNRPQVIAEAIRLTNRLTWDELVVTDHETNVFSLSGRRGRSKAEIVESVMESLVALQELTGTEHVELVELPRVAVVEEEPEDSSETIVHIGDPELDRKPHNTRVIESKRAPVSESRNPDMYYGGEGWKASAMCQFEPPAIFFPSDARGVEKAKKICSTCPVKNPCLEFALSLRIDHGVWGGTSERQRRRMTKKKSQV